MYSEYFQDAVRARGTPHSFFVSAQNCAFVPRHVQHRFRGALSGEFSSVL